MLLNLTRLNVEWHGNGERTRRAYLKSQLSLQNERILETENIKKAWKIYIVSMLFLGCAFWIWTQQRKREQARLQ